MLATLGIGVIWGLSPQILSKTVPETEVALMAGQYLRILLIGAWVNNLFPVLSYSREGHRRVLTVENVKSRLCAF